MVLTLCLVCSHITDHCGGHPSPSFSEIFSNTHHRSELFSVLLNTPKASKVAFPTTKRSNTLSTRSQCFLLSFFLIYFTLVASWRIQTQAFQGGKRGRARPLEQRCRRLQIVILTRFPWCNICKGL